MGSWNGLSRRGFIGGVAAGLVVAGVGESAIPGSTAYASENAVEVDPKAYVDVQLLSITDLHGYLQPTEVGGYNLVQNAAGVQTLVGGAGYLAAHLKRLRAGKANSLFFSAGDNFSGWAFEADALANEPTIEVLNAMGLNFSTVGNHELDQQFPEFLIDHMLKGDPLPVAGRDDSFIDSTGHRFRGANFGFYTSNVVYTDSGYTIVPPYNIEYVNAGRGRKLPIAFIHMTLAGTTDGSTSYQPALSQLDDVTAINTWAAKLKAKGVNAIVVVMHEGGVAGKAYDTATNPSGVCFQIAPLISADVSAIVTGHWHEPFNAMVPDPNGDLRPVVEAGCYGQLINEINLKLDPRTGEVIRSLTTSTNHPNSHDVPPDPQVQAIANYWTGQAVKRFSTPVSRQTGDFKMIGNDFGESTMGNLIADAIYWDAQQHGDVDLAVFAAAPLGQGAMNNPLPYAAGPVPGDADGRLLFGEAWNNFGYGDPVLIVGMTGAAIHAGLEQQWHQQSGGAVTLTPLTVSHNVSYTVDTSAPVGQRIDPTKLLIDGKPIDLNATYRLAALTYTLLGADQTTGFTVYSKPVVRGSRDREAFISYLRAHPTISPAPLNRVRAAN
ncbi:bifunctional metallophosphatase/5'-nucleotidase [Rugosimonospora africana]|uniref:Bifunctional metallophosphatase/5'-nucleotidase n=1 Tax=Rugosimonospora africana TaxID=556532 RepID=A0A8J3QST5_9ACTN|nr:bifunctional metallophosphatase/5'-nucleotidase [Rugosimonospora africana]GIH16815.1 bifunctional metallophosphatase/5'-nucleotidase [Rugosimonospora africana]